MLEIVLIRPGSTDYDQQRRIQGSLDIPLNTTGNTEVGQLIDQLYDDGIDTVYAPASEPANQTADALAEGLGVKRRKLERMRNLDQGLWQGMLIDDVRRKQPKVYKQWQDQPDNVCPPGGEMLADAEDRVRTAMLKLIRRHKDGKIAVVVSEPLRSLVRRFLTRSELGNLWQAGNGKPWEVIAVDTESLLAPTS